MFEFEKLTREEVKQLKPVKQAGTGVDLSAYTHMVSELEIGEGGRIKLQGEPGTEAFTKAQRLQKRRTTTAARQLGKDIKWRNAPEGQLLFEVVAKASATSEPKAKGKGGRPKKAATASAG